MTKAFARFADREGLEDAALCEAVWRIARKGGGRSGGFRTIVLFRRSELAFVYGFAGA